MGLLQYLFRKRKKVPVYREKRIPVKVIEAKEVTEVTEEVVTQPEVTGEIEEMTNEVENLIKDTNERIERIEEMVQKIGTSMNGSKKAIEDKVHSESVKVYRNVQAILVDLEKKVAMQDKVHQEMQTLRNYMKGLVGITAITMLMLVAFILYSIGVF